MNWHGEGSFVQGMHAITPLGAVRAGLAAGSGELPQCNALDLMQGVLACYSMRCDWDPTSCGVGGALGGGAAAAAGGLSPAG